MLQSLWCLLAAYVRNLLQERKCDCYSTSKEVLWEMQDVRALQMMRKLHLPNVTLWGITALLLGGWTAAEVRLYRL